MNHPTTRTCVQAATTELPFIEQGDGAIFWSVPPAECYSVACIVGTDYAAHFLQYLSDNPKKVGMNLLGIITSSINFSDESDSKGYHIGFFSELESALIYGSKTPYEDADRSVAEELDSMTCQHRVES